MPVDLLLRYHLNIWHVFFVACLDKECKEYRVMTIAGSDRCGCVDGSGSDARFNHIRAMVADGKNTVFVYDEDMYCIRRISMQGKP